MRKSRNANLLILSKKIGAALFATFAITVAHAQQDVTRLDPPQPVENDGKVEVLEFFAYGCGHCANLEPSLERWIKKQRSDVKVKRVPSPAPLMGIDSSVLYYSLEAMGQINRLHAKIFDAVHVQKVVLGNPAVLNSWLEKNGVDPKKYDDVKKSFSVATKVNRARQMVGQYQLHVTPTMVVNGRFAVEPGNSSTAIMFAKIDQLIMQARASVKSAMAPVVSHPPTKKPAAVAAK